MSMPAVMPDYSEAAEKLLTLVRLADNEMAKRLIKSELGTAFAAGGIKALDMVREGVERL